jgi:hypothetical protein
MKVFDENWFKKFVESYRCRICKIPLNLENLGGFGENHMIYCKDCRKNFVSDIFEV